MGSHKFPFILSVFIWLVVLLPACSVYRAKPLPEQSDLVPVLTPHMIQDLPYPVDLADGLDMTEIATLAVVRNPDMMAVRLKNKVAGAQAFAAGLLPDPQFAASRDTPTGNDPGLITGYSRELSLDLGAWLTHGVGKDIAVAEQRRVQMETLWQEWQLIQQVRSVDVKHQFAAKKLALLEQMENIAAIQSDHTQRALHDGDVTLDRADADLTMLMDARSLLREQQRVVLETGQTLNALLGLKADADIKLTPLAQPAWPPDTVIRKALSSVSRRRPDLLALQAGYQSQEINLYRAVLQQFPSITVGINRARDTSDVHTHGLSFSLNLPLFDGNRGEIAVQTATREQLHQEYQARLDQAETEITGLWRQVQLLSAQYDNLGRQLPQLEESVDDARKAYRAGRFPAAGYLSLANSALNKQLEYLDLQQSRWIARIALDTVLALPVLPVTGQFDTDNPSNIDTSP